jgi:hypothetical protein
MQRARRGRIQQCRGQSVENANFALADQLKELFESDEQIPTSGWMADAVNAYLSEINWHEIAKHYIAEVEIEQEA